MVRRLTSLTPIYRKGNWRRGEKGTDTGNFPGQRAGQTPGPPLGGLRALLSRERPCRPVRGRPLPFLEAKAPRLCGPMPADWRGFRGPTRAERLPGPSRRAQAHVSWPVRGKIG